MTVEVMTVFFFFRWNLLRDKILKPKEEWFIVEPSSELKLGGRSCKNDYLSGFVVLELERTFKVVKI